MKIKNTKNIKKTHKNRKHQLKRRRTLKGGDPSKIIELLSTNTTNPEFNLNTICRDENLFGDQRLCEQILVESMGKVSVYSKLYAQYKDVFDPIINDPSSPKNFSSIFESRCDTPIDPSKNLSDPVKKQILYAKEKIVDAMLSKLPSDESDPGFVELTEKKQALLDKINQGDLTIEETEKTNLEIKSIMSSIDDMKSLIDGNTSGKLKGFLSDYFGINGNLKNCDTVKKIVRIVMIMSSIMKYSDRSNFESVLDELMAEYIKLVSLYESNDSELTFPQQPLQPEEQQEEQPQPPNLYGGKIYHKKLTKKRRTQKGGMDDPYVNRQLYLDTDYFYSPFKETATYVVNNKWKMIMSVGIAPLYLFARSGYYKIKTYFQQSLRTKSFRFATFNKMEKIISEIPRNIRSLTYIIFYTIQALIKFDGDRLMTFINDDENNLSNYNFYHSNSPINNPFTLTSFVTNFKLETLMPSSVLGKNYNKNVNILNYHYALLFESLKNNLLELVKKYTVRRFPKLAEHIVNILNFCTERIYLLCKIFNEILQDHEKEKSNVSKKDKTLEVTYTINMSNIGLSNIVLTLDDIINKYIRYFDVYNNQTITNQTPIKNLCAQMCRDESFEESLPLIYKRLSQIISENSSPLTDTLEKSGDA